MAIDNSFIFKRFSKNKKIYVLISKATNLPYIECDEETFADQTYAFVKEDAAKEYARAISQDGYALNIVNIPNTGFERFLTQLQMIGADTLCIVDEGAPFPISLSEINPEPKIMKTPDPSIPESNPELELTAIYFLQELRKPVDGERTREELKHLTELEEEMAVNLMRSKLIVCLDTTDVKGGWQPGKKTEGIRIPFIKNKKQEIFQPLFSDFTEFRKLKFEGGRQISMMGIDFEKLPGFLVNSAKAFVINPMGVNLILNAEQIRNMVARYGGLS